MFDPEIDTAWRRVLQPGIEFMKSRYYDKLSGRSCGIWKNLFGGSRRKMAKKIAKTKRCYANTLRPRSIRSDALYPALNGEWEVPVIRNAFGAIVPRPRR